MSELTTKLKGATEYLEGGDACTADRLIIGYINQAIAELEQAQVMREALASIEEYWNRDENEAAMSDALWHIIETAKQALEAGK